MRHKVGFKNAKDMEMFYHDAVSVGKGMQIAVPLGNNIFNQRLETLRA